MGAEGLYALGGPAFEFVLGDALQPAVDDGADVAGGFADPGEFDSLFVAAFGRLSNASLAVSFSVGATQRILLNPYA